jgi:hypothetical protein
VPGSAADAESDFMRIGGSDLRFLAERARAASEQQLRTLARLLHRRQPDFCQDLDWVGIDPRCAAACRFCTAFCALALEEAGLATEGRIPAFPETVVHNIAGVVARRERDRLAKRDWQHLQDVRLNVLSRGEFDEDDSGWLCTRITTFLILLDGATGPSTEKPLRAPSTGSDRLGHAVSVRLARTQGSARARRVRPR